MENERIELARNFVRTALKVKKLLQIYPSNNIIYQNAIDEIFSVARKYFAADGDLVINVTSSELLVGSEQVFQAPVGTLARMDNLALFFFKEGIKELTFKTELLKNELEEFLKLLGHDFDRDETGPDFVSALWERGFENIKFTIDEIAYIDDDLPGTPLLSQAVGKGEGQGESGPAAEEEALESGIEFLSSISSQGDMLAEETPEDISRTGRREDSKLIAAHRDALSAEDALPIATAELTPQERGFILAEAKDDIPAETGRLADILLKMLATCRDKAEADSISKSIESLMAYALKGNDIRSVLATLKGAIAMPHGDDPSAGDNTDSDQSETYADKVSAFCSSPAAMQQLERILDSSKQISEEDLLEFARVLGRRAIASFIDLLDRLQSISARRMVNNVLISIGEQDIKVLAENLKSPTWYVVRNIIYVLRNIGNTSVTDDIIATARHEHPRVRLEVVKALSRFDSVKSFQALTEFLDDPDSTVRLSAITVIRTAGKGTGLGLIARDAILVKIKDKGFGERDFKEKKSLCETLALLGDSETDKYMLRLLGKKSLFAGRKNNENRACAAYYLGLTGNIESIAILEKLRSAADPLLRDHASAALQRMRHE
ncbi:MAG TPA: HEAT repeat domain-containing protein [Dissulfurispiraceae bacterium]|nr:HEAT repeat domain-containing protein [Dissulfurispiraceae bacterium]